MLSNSAIQIKFDSNTVSISGGCNSLSASYQAYENKTISILDFSGSNNNCKVDNDKQITDALKNSVSYQQSSDNKITLNDNLGKKIQTLSVAPVAKPVTFEGNYTTSIPNDPDLIIKFNPNNQVSILNGCNTYSGSYEADSLGNIVFKQFIGTLKACSVDFDNLYTKALSNSVTYSTSGNKIIFRDLNKA